MFDLSDTDLVADDATIDENVEMVTHAVYFKSGVVEYAHFKRDGFNPDANNPDGFTLLMKSIYAEYASLKTVIPYNRKPMALGELAYTVFYNPKYEDHCMEFYVVSDRVSEFDMAARAYAITGHFCSIPSQGIFAALQNPLRNWSISVLVSSNS